MIKSALTSQILSSIRSARSGSRAFIVYGPQGIGKCTAVQEAARELLGLKTQAGLVGHPNCLWINVKDTPITATDVRGITNFIYNTSYFADIPKLAIIDGANNLNIQSMNALLKPLEDLPRQTHFILIANNLRTLPATVLSRCSIVRALPPADDAIKAEFVANCPSLSVAEIAEYRYITSSPKTVRAMVAVNALETYKAMLYLLATERHPSAKLYEFIETHVTSADTDYAKGSAAASQLAIFRILITHLLSKAIKFKAGTLRTEAVVIKAELLLFQSLVNCQTNRDELADLLDRTIITFDKANTVGLDPKAVVLTMLSPLLA